MPEHPASEPPAELEHSSRASDESEGAIPSLLEYPATYLLIAINLTVFAAMAAWGSLPIQLRMQPGMGFGAWLEQLFTTPFSEATLVRFGACSPAFVLGADQWWRLLASTFVHVTLLHVLLNMWCLWNLGLFGERLLGKAGLVAVYVLTGTAGMLLSVILSVLTARTDLLVAGASGAVFGLAGILIVLLSNRRLAAPWAELRSLRLQVIFFALANLALGEAPQLLPRFFPGLLPSLHLSPGALPAVDNSAHLGGFLTGLLLGAPLFPRMTSTRSSYQARQGLVFGSAGLLLVLCGYALWSFVHGPVHGHS